MRTLWLWLTQLCRALRRNPKRPEPSPPLPKGTRYFNKHLIPSRRQHEPLGLLIVEKEPSRRSVIGDKKTYFVPFPYVIFIIRFTMMAYNGKLLYSFHKLQVGFRSKPLKWADDCVSALPLSNYEGDMPLGVCLGGGPRPAQFETPEEMAKVVIGHYWLSSFTKLNRDTMARWMEMDNPYSLLFNSHPLREVAYISKGEELNYG